MDADSKSVYSDPGLFDNPKTEQVPTTASFEQTNSAEAGRRVYRPVPAEQRQSTEYQIRRERNNRAVKRARTNNKVKQQCLTIKAEGYRKLASEYNDAAQRMLTERQNLMALFRARMETGPENANIQGAMAREAASREEFADRLESIRREYANRIQEISEETEAVTSAASRSQLAPSGHPRTVQFLPPTQLLRPSCKSSPLSCSSDSPSLSNVSSQSSLRQYELQSSDSYHHYSDRLYTPNHGDPSSTPTSDPFHHI